MRDVFYRKAIIKVSAGFRVKKLFPLLVFICLSFKTFSQNDACGSATALSTGVTAGTNAGSTTSASDPTSSWDGDAHYSYSVCYTYTTGASGGSLTVDMTHGTIQYGSLAIYSGTCGSFTQLACSVPNTSTANPSATVTCLAPNTTYYIMIW